MSIWFSKVTNQEMIDMVSSMRSSAAGFGYISLRIVKSILPFFVQNFVDMNNVCFKEGLFPSSFKRAKFVPLFKEGDQKILINYRTISLLPSFSKSDGEINICVSG